MMDRLLPVCDVYQNDVEKISRHFIDIATQFEAEKGIKIYE